MADFVGVTAPLYERLVHSGKNILIAGTTGSGKSTLINGIVNSILLEDVNEHKTVLIDVKMVELGDFEVTQHCLRCATSVEDAESTLDAVMSMIQERLKYMKTNHLKQYDGSFVHLIIDELADLLLTSKKATNTLQRICQLGRAANVQVIVATQCPLATVIPTRIKVNFPITIGLHTVTAQQSRNILDVAGCEDLRMPDAQKKLSGEALIRYPGEELQRVTVPKIPDDKLTATINYRTPKLSVKECV